MESKFVVATGEAAVTVDAIGSAIEACEANERPESAPESAAIGATPAGPVRGVVADTTRHR
ncbi:MAG: hypothetical protein RLZZ01_2374 [Actinomycetota bacterium]